MIEISIKLDKENQVWKWLESKDNSLLNAGHIGTHIDVYKKSDIPKEYIKTKGVYIDCKKYDVGEEIGIEIVKNINIEKGNFILFDTGIQNKHPYGSDVYIHNHHVLSFELIEYLLDKKVSFIGIDCAGIRRGKEHYEADVKCENNNTYVVENLDFRNLTDKSEIEISVYTIWIDNPIATGLSTRVFVEYN